MSHKVYGMLLLVLCCVFMSTLRAEDNTLERALLKMQNQVNTLENEIATYSGKIEELQHENERLSLENSELKAKLEKNTKKFEESLKNAENSAATLNAHTQVMQKVEGGGTATLTSHESKPKKEVEFIKEPNPSKKEESEDKALTLKPSTTASKKEYQQAYDLLEKNELDKAAFAFSKFAATYPNDMLLPNSFYWLGQIQYLKKDYASARVSFLNTAKYKNTQKRPDALYKLGLTSEALGDLDKAKRFYTLLIKNYPDSSSTLLAKKALQKLNENSSTSHE